MLSFIHLLNKRWKDSDETLSDTRMYIQRVISSPDRDFLYLEHQGYAELSRMDTPDLYISWICAPGHGETLLSHILEIYLPRYQTISASLTKDDGFKAKMHLFRAFRVVHEDKERVTVMYP